MNFWGSQLFFAMLFFVVLTFLGTVLTPISVASHMCFPAFAEASSYESSYDNEYDVIAAFLGLTELSEADPYDLEHFQQLLRHPLPLNGVGKSRLSESGLFSSYQVESLLDYRERNGQILSPRELAQIDGFGEHFAALAASFLSFEPFGNEPFAGFSHSEEAFSGASLRISEGEASYSFVSKAVAEFSGQRGVMGASLAYKLGNTPWKETPREHIVGGNLSLKDGKHLRSLVLGCFNARFGQGLAQWSGVVMDSFSTPSSLMKRPSLILPYTGWSTSYAMCGAAALVALGPFSLAPYADVTGGKYGMASSWSFRAGNIGLGLHYSGTGLLSGYSEPALALSADYQHSLGAAVLFAELMCRPHFSSYVEYGIVGGVRYRFGTSDMGLRLQASHKDFDLSAAWACTWGGMKHGMNVGLKSCFYHSGSYRTPAGAMKNKLTAAYIYDGALGRKGTLKMETKFNLSLKNLTPACSSEDPYFNAWPFFRTDLSQRVSMTWDQCSAGLKLCGGYLAKRQKDSQDVYGHLFGMVALDGGYEAKWCRLKIQAALFAVDDWDGRIYWYQYDAPGMFNLSALYGRGWSTAAYCVFRLWKFLKIHIRVGYSSYPSAFQTSEVPVRSRPSLDARLCLSFEISGKN